MTTEPTTARSGLDVFTWADALLAPYIPSGEVYWTTKADWAAPAQIVRPIAGRWVSCSICKGGNEALHLTVMARLQFGVIEEPQWYPVLTAKVWTAADAGRLAGELLAASAEFDPDYNPIPSSTES